MYSSYNRWLKAFETFELPYSENYQEPEIIRFLKYEAFFNPNSVLTQVINEVYNVADATSQVETDEIIENILINELVDYWQSFDGSEGRVLSRRFMRTLERRVERLV